MNYLPMLTEDEIHYICSVIPLQSSVGYFKHNPKNFAKVMPGFRPTSLKKEQISSVLFRSRNLPFISSFIERHISNWLDEIGEAIKKKADEGKCMELVLLETLPHCFFVDNIRLYFKLTSKEYAEEYLSLLSESIKIIKESVKERNQVNALLDTRIAAFNRLESELERIRTQQTILTKKFGERLDEIKTLKRTNLDLEKSKSAIVSLERIIASLKEKEQEREDYIHQLRADLTLVKEEQSHFEQKIKEESARQQKIVQYRQECIKLPKRPKDLEEFKDYLGYNLENIGVPTTADYYPLLKGHISEMLFLGQPIVISRSAGTSLMKCISNALVKTSFVPTLAFTTHVTEVEIDSFLSLYNRVLCLDNFIGNYNETQLVVISERHRDKIIFLTVAYENTLAYVADELFRYCNYLNLNRIEAFSETNIITEDPSVVEEETVTTNRNRSDTRWSAALKEIFEELGIRGALLTYKSSLVTNELSFCQLLAFDILPYCTDVLKIAPFNTSESLLDYAGINGRCMYKDLFKRWFY